MNEYKLEISYCPRCGTKLTAKNWFTFTCKQGHPYFYNAGMGTDIAMFNVRGQVLVTERLSSGPGAGLWDLPGGFCDGAEQLEAAAMREVQEEVGLNSDQYSQLEYLGSGVSVYHYGGQVLPVMSVVFKAQVRDDAVPRASDDAAKVWFADLETLDLDMLYSATARRVLGELRAKN